MKLILLSTEEIVAFDKCLIASGSHAKTLSVAVPEGVESQVTTFHNVRTLECALASTLLTHSTVH